MESGKNLSTSVKQLWFRISTSLYTLNDFAAVLVTLQNAAQSRFCIEYNLIMYVHAYNKMSVGGSQYSKSFHKLIDTIIIDQLNMISTIQ